MTLGVDSDWQRTVMWVCGNEVSGHFIIYG